MVFGLPGWLSGKDSACNEGDKSSIPGSGRFLGEENGNPLPYSCLGNPKKNPMKNPMGNPMNRGAWQTTVHGVTKSGYGLVTKTL